MVKKESGRNLTDDDISALVKELRAEFYLNLGKGLWGFAWKGAVLAIIALSIYGATHKGL